MKKMLIGVVVLAAALFAALYWYTKVEQPATAEPFTTFTCGNFTFTYPSSWYVWRERELADMYSDGCNVATFPRETLEEKLVGIANLTKSEQDAFITFYATPNVTQSLSEYIDSIYCIEGTACMGQYMENKTAIPFDSGEAFRVVESGGEYPPSSPYYYKKGTTVLEVRFDRKNQERASEILSIAESVR